MKGMFKGLVGLALIYFGVGFTLGAISSSLFAAIYHALGIPTITLAGLAVLQLAIGLILLYFGGKWAFESESGIIRAVFGFIGLLLFIGGIMAALGGVVTGGVTLFAALLLWSVSLAFMGYGFQIKFLAPFASLVKHYKSVIGV